jgi:hypothetical protein
LREVLEDGRVSIRHDGDWLTLSSLLACTIPGEVAPAFAVFEGWAFVRMGAGDSRVMKFSDKA